MIYFIIAGLVIYLMYKFFSDRDKMLSKQLEPYGGIRNKYSILINYLMGAEKSKIETIRRDYICISCASGTMYWHIQETFGEVNIELKSPIIPSNKWEYRHNIPQQYIIQDIEMYFEEIRALNSMRKIFDNEKK